MAKTEGPASPLWRVRVCLPGAIVHLTSRTEPDPYMFNGRIHSVTMELVTDTRHRRLHRLAGGRRPDVARRETGSEGGRRMSRSRKRREAADDPHMALRRGAADAP
jgi:hypothetical protein